MKKTTPFLAALMITLLASCNLSNEPTAVDSQATPVAVVITATLTDTPDAPPATAENLPPTATPAPTESPTSEASPTDAATATNTEPPTVTPTPSLTPQATIGFRFDQWDRVELPDAMVGGATRPMVIFTNSNDQETITSISTARPENETMFVYAVDPSSTLPRVTLLELNAATGNRIFPSESGKAMAYFREGAMAPGLYILNLAAESGSGQALLGRIAPINTLVQRGIYSAPTWSPDGDWLAVTLATAYDLDIFLYERDGDGRKPLLTTLSGAYEFYPAFSPDGRYVAFVSDRATCPSWVPGEADACDPLTTPPPTGGQVYIVDLETQEVRQISEEYVTEPPYWISNTQLAFAVGDTQDLLKPERRLWLANIPGKTAREIALPGDASGLYLSDVWSPDGTKLLFQHVTPSASSIVMMNTDGTVIQQRTEDLLFPRYGMRASWSPLLDRIVLGGTSGECPYGVRVVDPAFDFVATGSPAPTLCNPVFAPNGRYIAFMGVSSVRDRANPDGRLDVYVSDQNGFGQRNVSADLRGSMNLIGWLGGKTVE